MLILPFLVVAALTRVGAMRHGELLAPGITSVLDEAWVPRQEVTAPGSAP